VQSALRDTDVLARWGGEEFLVLLNDTTPELANLGLERARSMLANAEILLTHPELIVAFSAGLTGYSEDEPLDVCIERADQALYRAKHEGRDRTVFAPDPALSPKAMPEECVMRG
jgi:diguanylate cyclase (GGDEF)-like protein